MLDVGTKFTFVDNSRAVIKASEEGSFEALKASGAYIRTVASRSIKRKKETRDPKTGRPMRPGSPAGTPPYTYSGHLKKVFRFYVDKKEQSVTIGPVNQFAETIWDRLEKGGTYRDNRKKNLKRRTFAMGDFGPIASNGSGGKIRHIKLKSAGQVRRANEMIDQVNAQREAASQQSKTYPARPFMGPALAKSQDKVAKFWEGSVK